MSKSLYINNDVEYGDMPSSEKCLLRINRLTEILFSHFEDVKFEIIYQEITDKSFVVQGTAWCDNTGSQSYMRIIQFTFTFLGKEYTIFGKSVLNLKNHADIVLCKALKGSQLPLGKYLQAQFEDNEITYRLRSITRESNKKLCRDFVMQGEYYIRERSIFAAGHEFYITECFPIELAEKFEFGKKE